MSMKAHSSVSSAAWKNFSDKWLKPVRLWALMNFLASLRNRSRRSEEILLLHRVCTCKSRFITILNSGTVSQNGCWTFREWHCMVGRLVVWSMAFDVRSYLVAFIVIFFDTIRLPYASYHAAACRAVDI